MLLDQDIVRPEEKQLLREALGRLPEPSSRQQIRGKIIKLQPMQTTMAHFCSQAKMRVVVDIPIKMDEVECSCGTLFQR